MNNKEKHRLHNNWEYAKELWDKKSKELKLTDWSLKQNNTKTSLGVCNHNKKTIYISTYFMRGPSCNYNKVKHCLLHEISHALTPGQKHNLIWKKMCIKLGGDGRVCATMDIPARSWKLKCDKCKWVKEYYRKPKLDNKVCIKCKRKPKLEKI